MAYTISQSTFVKVVRNSRAQSLAIVRASSSDVANSTSYSQSAMILTTCELEARTIAKDWARELRNNMCETVTSQPILPHIEQSIFRFNRLDCPVHYPFDLAFHLTQFSLDTSYIPYQLSGCNNYLSDAFTISYASSRYPTRFAGPPPYIPVRVGGGRLDPQAGVGVGVVQ